MTEFFLTCGAVACAFRAKHWLDRGGGWQGFAWAAATGVLFCDATAVILARIL